MATNLFDLSGKIALVSGASRGIGESIARIFAEQGAHVIVSSRKIEDSLEKKNDRNFQKNSCSNGYYRSVGSNVLLFSLNCISYHLFFIEKYGQIY